MDGGVGAVRLLDLEELPGAAQEHLVRVEGDPAVDEVPLEAFRVVAKSADRDVLPLAFVDRLGRGEGGAPPPLLRDPWVAGGRHRPGPEVRPHVEAVRVEPADAVLGLGQEEAVLHERLRLEVELAHDVRVGPAARKLDEAALVLRLQAVGPVPDPVLLLRGAERVEVDHRLPRRVVLAVLGERRAPPEAAGVLRVAPEVVVPGPELLDERDAGVRVQDVEDALLEGGEVAGFQDLCALGVAGPRPVEGLLPRHVLEPEVAVLGGGRLGGVAGGGRSGRAHGQHEGEGEAVHRGSSRLI